MWPVVTSIGSGAGRGSHLPQFRRATEPGRAGHQRVIQQAFSVDQSVFLPAADFFGHLRGSAFRRQAEMAFFHTPLESELSSGATRDRHPLDALLTTRGQQEDVRRMAGV